MADGVKLEPQFVNWMQAHGGTQPQSAFNPVDELYKKYPALAEQSHDEVVRYASNPDNIRKAFPEYDGLHHVDDDKIRTWVARGLRESQQPALQNFIFSLAGPGGDVLNMADAWMRSRQSERERASIFPNKTGLDYSTRIPEAARYDVQSSNPFTVLNRMTTPENIARSSEPPANAPWYSPERVAAATVRGATSPMSLFRGPTTPEEAGTQFSGGYPAMLGERLAAPNVELWKKVEETQKAQQERYKQGKGFSPKLAAENLVAGAGAPFPVVGPALASIPLRALEGDPLGALSDVGVLASLGGAGAGWGSRATKARAITRARDPIANWNSLSSADRLAYAHDNLSAHAEAVKGQLQSAAQNVSARVGELRTDLVTADTKANPQPSIVATPVMDKLAEVAENYAGAGGTFTPKFNAAVKAVQQRAGRMSLGELLDLRTEVGRFGSMARTGVDKATVSQLYNTLTGMAQDRAAALGKADTFAAYNKLHRVTRAYYDDGAVGKLLNADGGKPFFDALADPANVIELRRANLDLQKFGLPERFFDTLKSDHGPVHEFVRSGGKTGMKGAISAIRSHPIAGLAGAFAGGKVGALAGHPVLGTMVGASKAADWATSRAAGKAIEATGGIQPVTGKFGSAADVMPSETEPPQATTPPSRPSGPAPAQSKATVDPADIAQALVDQMGYRKSVATTLANEAARRFPTDFDAALKSALQRNPQQAMAEAIQNAQQVTPRQPLMLPERAGGRIDLPESPLGQAEVEAVRRALQGRNIEYTGTGAPETSPAVRDFLARQRAAGIARVRQTTQQASGAPTPVSGGSTPAPAIDISTPASKAEGIKAIRAGQTPGSYGPQLTGQISPRMAQISELQRELKTTTDPAERAKIQQGIDYLRAGEEGRPFNLPQQAEVENLPLRQPRTIQPELSPREGPVRGLSPNNPLTAQEMNVGDAGYIRTEDLAIDPKRFQYKATGDEGVTNLLKDVRTFDPQKAGVVQIWRDTDSGQLYVVNGHHRFELAKRTGQPALLVTSVKAATAGEARAVGAITNIAEGRGTALDAAKFFRDTGMKPEDLERQGLSLAEGRVSEGLALSKLDPFIFGKVATGEIPEAQGVAIGNATADAAQQQGIFDLIKRAEARGKRLPTDTVAELARNVVNTSSRVEQTADLFGPQSRVFSNAVEKADVSAYVKQQLAREQRTFGAVSTEGKAKVLGGVEGQTIQAEKNRAISQQAGQALEVFDKLSSRKGPVDDILEDAATKQASGYYKPDAVRKEAYGRIRAELQKSISGEK